MSRERNIIHNTPRSSARYHRRRRRKLKAEGYGFVHAMLCPEAFAYLQDLAARKNLSYTQIFERLLLEKVEAKRKTQAAIRELNS